MIQLTSLATGHPRHCVSTAETKEFLASLLPVVEAEKFWGRVDASQIRTRHTLAPLRELGGLPTLEDREAWYQREAVTLGERVAQGALEVGATESRDIDLLILTSSTGHMIPTPDLHLRSRIGLRPDVRSISLTGLGCSGAVRAIALASDLLTADHAWHAALVISVELCSLWLQVAEPSPEDVLSNVTFGDGAAAALMVRDDVARAPEVVASRTVLWPDSLAARGARVTGTGLRHFCAPTLPRTVRTHLRETVHGFLADEGVAASDIGFYAINPSDQRLLRTAGTILDVPDRDVAAALSVWEQHGNTLSSGPLLVLQAVQAQRQPKEGDLGLLVVFGPGITCEMLLLRWRGRIKHIVT